jgi:hypothetical protein
MKNKKFLALVLSAIILSTSIGTTAFANTNTLTTSNTPTITQINGATIISGTLSNPLDESWLKEYTVESATKVLVPSVGGNTVSPMAIIDEDASIISRDYRYFTFTASQNSTAIGTILAAVGLIPYTPLRTLVALTTPSILQSASEVQTVYTIATYYHLRNANGTTAYAIATSQYRYKNGWDYSGYIQGTYNVYQIN